MTQGGKRRVGTGAVVAITAGVALLDQVTKWHVLGGLTRAFDDEAGAPLGFALRLANFLFMRHPTPTGSYPVIDGLWHFVYAENPGAAWSIFRDTPVSLRLPFLLLVGIGASVGIAWYLRRSSDAPTRVGLALVLGGAIGNLFDRVRLGYVIDFVVWHWGDRFAWPTFNIADCGIAVGAALVLGVALWSERPALKSSRLA